MTWNASNFNERWYKSHVISIIKFVNRNVVDILIICGFKYLMIISVIKLCIDVFVEQWLIFYYVFVQNMIYVWWIEA
jgi:hypothetical protein